MHAVVFISVMLHCVCCTYTHTAHTHASHACLHTHHTHMHTHMHTHTRTHVSHSVSQTPWKMNNSQSMTCWNLVYYWCEIDILLTMIQIWIQGSANQTQSVCVCVCECLCRIIGEHWSRTLSTQETSNSGERMFAGLPRQRAWHEGMRYFALVKIYKCNLIDFLPMSHTHSVLLFHKPQEKRTTPRVTCCLNLVLLTAKFNWVMMNTQQKLAFVSTNELWNLFCHETCIFGFFFSRTIIDQFTISRCDCTGGFKWG